jgi:hypothetical protein
MKSKVIQNFENFNKDYFDNLIISNRTYIKKKLPHGEILNIVSYNDIIEKIKNYNIENFSHIKSYIYFIYPDQDFILLIKNLNKVITNQIPLDIKFEFSINESLQNRIDFEEGIPLTLRGLNLGYKLYKFIINKLGFITSEFGANAESKNIWYKLMLDTDLYCFTSNIISGVICKSRNDFFIKECLEKVKNYNLIFDEEIEEKITELYGTMELYKQ